MAGPHVSDPKAGAFKAPKLCPEGGGWLGAKRPYDTCDHHDTTMVYLVRLHLRMQTNLLSFANEYVCITLPVFSLQIISHSKRDTIN